MNLMDLIKNMDIISINGSTDLVIEQIQHDSRKVQGNCLFVALEGFTVDGHQYVSQAIAKGAVAIISKNNIALEKGVTLIRVKNTRVALARTTSIFYNEPSKKLGVIGVTGTNGKTTTTYLIDSIFQANGENVGIIGSIGNIINGKLYKTKNTTPESLELQEILHQMVEAKVDKCTMEASSHALELHRVDYCDFDIGVFTNLTVDHLDYHKTIDNYLKAKLKLFFKTKKCNIINMDDQYGEDIISEINKLDVPLLTYGINNNADIYATNVEYRAEGVKFKLNTITESIDITMNMPGLFNVYNALAAAACGVAYELPLEIIKEGLELIEGVKGRFETVPTNRDFTVIIDSAHTPDSLKKALETIDQFAKGRKIIVFGAGGDRDRSKRGTMGEIVANNSEFCIITSDNPRTEDPERIIKEVEEGVKRVSNKYVAIVDRKEAIKYAIKNSQPNDVILLAGKGHENYIIIGREKKPFNEREIVMEALSELDEEV